MKHTMTKLLSQAVALGQQNGWVPAELSPEIVLEHTKDKSHGDFASNIALALAKPCGLPPRQVAERLIASFPQEPALQKVEIAGPGFINFFLAPNAQFEVVNTVLNQQMDYGRCNVGLNKVVFLEYVSANPTGPLHVGHGRGAALGASLANLLKFTGFDVHAEYYVNDAGRQMNILGTSVWLRYLSQHGIVFPFPSNGYKGEYVNDIAQHLTQLVGDTLVRDAQAVFANAPLDAQEDGSGDKEAHIDALIVNARQLLGEAAYTTVFNLGLNQILDDIRQDLAEFGVTFDAWFSEKTLMTSNAVQHAFDVLKANGWLYEIDGALWFKSTQFGDDKDRCVCRANGESTYFASDIAYTLNKFERGADKLVYIFGSDHHGYLPRLRACIEALGHKNEDVDFELVQFAILYRGSERVQMSTRSGSFVTLRELRNEVGNDAARFFYVMRKCDQHMDFDLDLAKSQSNENPVYYIQYAHARICQVFDQALEKNFIFDKAEGLANLPLLTEEHEQNLLRELSRFPEVISGAALAREPHRVALYLRELANAFHSYYNAHMFLVDNAPLRNARLSLVTATQQVLINGLKLIGVSAPRHM
jgi:arginyl-tRNA synthetase